jgi:hypothetical protein
MTKTKFCCLRRFRAFGVDHVEGEIVELTDDQVHELIYMENTIEPVAKADRCRVVSVPRITWEAPADDERTTHRTASQPWAVVLPGDVGYSNARLH